MSHKEEALNLRWGDENDERGELRHFSNKIVKS